MDTSIDITHEPDLGYIFFPRMGEDVFGNSRMDVIFHEHPTLRHYDPQSTRCTIAHNASSENFLIHHATPPGHFRICAGRVLITDRVQKHVEAFCFGGDLDIFHHQQETICVFQSPVPILDLNTYHSPDMLLANEVEILIAGRRAVWDPQHPHDFEAHLAQLDPVDLFIASLDALIAKFANPSFQHDPVNRQFFHMLETERSDWQRNGRWPVIVPKLMELL